MTEATIFQNARDIQDPARRAGYLDAACAADAALRHRVEILLTAGDASGEFLDVPAVEQMARRPGADTVDADADDLNFLAPPTQPGHLGRLGHYDVLEVLGRGGFGIVLKAFDTTLHRMVAIKVLAPAFAATSPPRKRFLREARAAAAVRHENVVAVHAVEENPLPYLVMEYVPGETLQQHIDRTGPLDAGEVRRLGRQVAEGLAAAHAMGLVHRDVKPANVLLEAGPESRAKLTDFGLARTADDASVTQSGQILGTPMYMAPEQALGKPFDQRADLFSLGSVLYVMATGRPPFRADSTLAVLRRVAEDTPRPIRDVIPETPAWLCDVIAKLHAKDPADRFATARGAADALAAGVGPGGPKIRRDTPKPEPRDRRTRTRSGWAVAIVLVFGAFALTACGGVLLMYVGLALPRVAARMAPPVEDGTVWETRVATMPSDSQLNEVYARLKLLNNGAPVGVEPATEKPVGADGKPRPIKRLSFKGDHIQDLSPVRALRDLEDFACDAVRRDGALRDLTPLSSLKLRSLSLRNTAVADLWPVSGMPLETLNVEGTHVHDLSPLTGMGIKTLNLRATKVKALWPLHGMPLKSLDLRGLEIDDLTPLRLCPLEEISFDAVRGANMPALREIKTLKTINGRPAAELLGKGKD